MIEPVEPEPPAPRPAWADAPWPEPPPGRAVVLLAWAGTAAFVVTSVVATVVMGWAQPPAVVVALALFAVGCGLFLWAYWQAIQRSREHEIGIGGLYFLLGPTAPAAVRRHLDGALAIQVAVAFTTASVRPFTTLAFGILVPVFGLGCNGAWAARHGRFGPRILGGTASEPRNSRSDPPMGQNAGHG